MIGKRIMKLNIFDVVKLNNGKTGIVKENKNCIKIEVIDEDGKSTGLYEIKQEEIDKVMYKNEITSKL